MIQERPASRPSMTQRESFEDFYTKKLEALRIKLKTIIKGDTPYVVSIVYACKSCSGRLKVHAQGHMCCLLCSSPPTWTKATVEAVNAILRDYPQLEESRQEWKASQRIEVPLAQEKQARLPVLRNGTIGQKIQKARLAMGLTQSGLAALVYRKDGQAMKKSSIQGYELGRTNPSRYVLGQLEKILGLEGEKNV